MKDESKLVRINSKEELVTYIGILFGMLQDYPNALTLEQVQEVLNIKEKQAYLPACFFFSHICGHRHIMQ